MTLWMDENPSPFSIRREQNVSPFPPFSPFYSSVCRSLLIDKLVLCLASTRSGRSFFFFHPHTSKTHVRFSQSSSSFATPKTNLEFSPHSLNSNYYKPNHIVGLIIPTTTAKMHAIYSTLLLAAALANAVKITSPVKNEKVDLDDGVTVRWETVSTDPAQAKLRLVNLAGGHTPFERDIATVDLSKGSYVVKLDEVPNDGGYQFNFESVEPGSTGILAQSEQFEVIDSGDATDDEDDVKSSSTSSASTATTSSATTTKASSETSSETATDATITSTATTLTTATTTGTATGASATSSGAASTSTSTGAAPVATAGSMLALAAAGIFAVLA